MENSELYLKTVFCCMACDGKIADEEVQFISDSAKKRGNLFEGLDIQQSLNSYVQEINEKGKAFLAEYLKEISKMQLEEGQCLTIISLAVETIKADKNVEYSEISFFKKIRKRLNISDEVILKKLPGIENLLLPDIDIPDELDWTIPFDKINIRNLGEIKS